jgi:dipeptidyl aminopeptidase/acylaminoacyl peptidase
MPHGGPFVAEFVAYDEWAQMLANNGFMVLQPQYRGSHNYGLAHYFAAWRDGSEAGRKMQDDKDDGALYLVEQGLADKDRLAMFGWSYGGYAALVAASRKPQIYQCVIAAAAVSDMVKQVNTIANEVWFRGAGEIEQMSYRKGAINPVDEVEDVNVPILLIHGSVDQRVQPIQAKIYYDRLDRYRKPYKFVELKGADHFYDTLYFEHQIRLYEAMIEFLNNDCGPNGL